MVLDGPHATAVDKRLVNCEIEPLVRMFHARAVERALAVVDRDAAATGAAGRGVVDAFLEEQEVDATVGSGLERLRPAGRRAAVAACFLAPALERRRLLLAPPAFEHGCGHLQEFGCLHVRLGMPPAADVRAR